MYPQCRQGQRSSGKPFRSGAVSTPAGIVTIAARTSPQSTPRMPAASVPNKTGRSSRVARMAGLQSVRSAFDDLGFEAGEKAEHLRALGVGHAEVVERGG